MLTCKETARLVSEGLDRRLGLAQRVSLRLHLMMCGACATYRRQIEAIDALVSRRFRAGGSGGRESLTDEARRRITTALRDRGR